MIVWVLVVWFGIGDNQTSFAVPNIASKPECDRLAAVMKSHYAGEVTCFPYRVPKEANGGRS